MEKDIIWDHTFGGIHFFPSSGNFFDPDGNLIYASINGINILEKY